MSFYKCPTYIVFSLKNHITLEKFPLSIFSVNPWSPKHEFILESYQSLTLCYNITFASKGQVYLFFLNILQVHFTDSTFVMEKVNRFKTWSVYKRKIHNRLTFDNSFKHVATGKPLSPRLVLIVRQTVFLSPIFPTSGQGAVLFFLNQKIHIYTHILNKKKPIAPTDKKPNTPASHNFNPVVCS